MQTGMLKRLFSPEPRQEVQLQGFRLILKPWSRERTHNICCALAILIHPPESLPHRLPTSRTTPRKCRRQRIGITKNLIG